MIFQRGKQTVSVFICVNLLLQCVLQHYQGNGANLPFGPFLWETHHLGGRVAESHVQYNAISLQFVYELCTPTNRLHAQHYFLHTECFLIMSLFLAGLSRSSFHYFLTFPICNTMCVCKVIEEFFLKFPFAPKLSFLAKSNPFLPVTWLEVVS